MFLTHCTSLCYICHPAVILYNYYNSWVFLLYVVSPVVKVGTEVTSYSVSEDIGVVELCIVANIVCPDADTISVSISTSAGSAGIIIGNNC